MTFHGIFLNRKAKLRQLNLDDSIGRQLGATQLYEAGCRVSFAFPYKMEDNSHFGDTSMCRKLEKKK